MTDFAYKAVFASAVLFQLYLRIQSGYLTTYSSRKSRFKLYDKIRIILLHFFMCSTVEYIPCNSYVEQEVVEQMA